MTLKVRTIIQRIINRQFKHTIDGCFHFYLKLVVYINDNANHCFYFQNLMQMTTRYILSFLKLIAVSVSLTAWLFINSCYAQQQQQMNSADIMQALKKLNTAGTVMYIAAHPDDENTRLLSYMAREKKLRTIYLSLTRGDGGQNLIGSEQAELLGLIRTQELLAARRIDGAEQFFTRANDFGYSKNPGETFNFWNKDSILADVVWAIRKFKPDVIICRFPTTGEGGHGHHTASAMLAEEAFTAAADPKKFPDQLAYTQIWQAKRLFWNTFNFGGNNTTSPDQFKTDVGAFNPLLGKGYGEIAAESRSMHKSQGFGSARIRGSLIEYFKLLKGDSVSTDLMEGIDQSLGRLKGAGKVQKLISDCMANFNLQHPEESINTLIEIYRQLLLLDTSDPITNYYQQLKLKETETLILNCAGIFIEAVAGDYMGVPGDSVTYTSQVLCRNSAKVKLNKIKLLKADTVINSELKTNELKTFNHKEILPQSYAYSNPYWLNQKHTPGRFIVNNQLLIGLPENTNQATVQYDININGLDLSITRGLCYKFTDPVKGEIYRPYEILPPVTVNLSQKVFVFTDTSPKLIKVTIVKPSANAGEGQLKISIKANGNVYNKSITRIEYDHIPEQFILANAEAKLENFKLLKGKTNIAYIPGAGDEVASCLKQVGYNVTELDEHSLADADLAGFNAIVLGIRAYNTNEWLMQHQHKLLEFVKNGGNLIVQYNTNSRIGPLQNNIGPYPFTISRERVTDENSPVQFENPAHPALNTPNKITETDFKNWIQERGIYFAGERDSSYQTILSMNDPGEKLNNGNTIICKYGKGNFVYSGLAFFRQLPAGVPGAYKLFVNLLSLPAER